MGGVARIAPNPYNAGFRGAQDRGSTEGTRVATDDAFDEEVDNDENLELDEDLELGGSLELDDDSDEELEEADGEQLEEDDSGPEEVEEDELDEEESEESLEVLLGTESDEDVEEEPRTRSASKAAATPIGEGEFTCRSCFLVKARAQLADGQRQICLDCA